MDADQGKRKCVVEDEVNLGVKPKKKFKNISPTIEELRRFTLPVEVTDEYQKYLTSHNRGKLPIDDSDDFVTPPPKHIKEPVPPKKAPKNAPSVQPVDYGRELQKLKADVKQLHKQLSSFMDYVSDKFKELFKLINSKLGASDVKYGAHPEEDTSGRQDNNDFVSNMEFGGNEDVEMDGCQRYSVADQLGVNAMEGPSGVKVDMFIAKVTFTPDVAHAGVIAGKTEEESEKQKVPESRTGVVCVTASVDAAAVETEEESEKQKVPESRTGVVCATASVDSAAGETEEESEKQKVPESRTGAVCATASVDAAAGETEEESEKQKVPESRTGAVCATASVDEAAGEMVLYNAELLPEVSPQMEKRKRCPAKAVQSLFITVFDLGSSTNVVAAKGER
ncbi:hypothetical protein A4A49_26868 [Nicotiana attenuata]|uniref:Uncharacterized protein n=1 Tax=Nicotiana attenuata TaxID=49451 RepID=A0A1J6KAB4_NICAT|nr:hypothetical protein A4A49_26868 [Nicotiana attenuata]